MVKFDRREYERYEAKEGFFAGAYPNVGQIVNVSMGGLAYNYMGMATPQEDEGEMVICGDDCLCIDDLTCKVLSDTVVSNGTSFSKFVTRQRRLQFVDMTPEQKVTLENFIRQNRQALGEDC